MHQPSPGDRSRRFGALQCRQSHTRGGQCERPRPDVSCSRASRATTRRTGASCCASPTTRSIFPRRKTRPRVTSRSSPSGAKARSTRLTRRRTKISRRPAWPPPWSPTSPSASPISPASRPTLTGAPMSMNLGVPSAYTTVEQHQRPVRHRLARRLRLQPRLQSGHDNLLPAAVPRHHDLRRPQDRQRRLVLRQRLRALLRRQHVLPGDGQHGGQRFRRRKHPAERLRPERGPGQLHAG